MDNHYLVAILNVMDMIAILAVAEAVASIRRLNVIGGLLIVVGLVEILAGRLAHRKHDKDETDKVDGGKDGEAVFAEVGVHLGPDGVDDKVEQPVGGVAQRGTSRQSVKGKKFGSNQPRDNTASHTVGESEEDG